MKSSTHDKAEGTAKNIAGNIKEATGIALGSQRLQAEGRKEQAEGQVQEKIGEIKKLLGN